MTPDQVSPLGTTTVVVTVEDAGNNRIVGETIIFSIDVNDSGGSFADISAVTDLNGQVFVNYTAGGTEGTDEIRARAASNSEFDTADIDVIGTITNIGSITLIAGSDTLPADGTSDVALRATVLGTDGQPRAATNVVFSSTLGDVEAPGNKDTDSFGVAELLLTAGNFPGTATVTAVTGGFIAQVEIEFLAVPADSVSLVNVPDPIAPFGTTTMRATLLDGANPVPGETLNFSIDTNNSGGSLFDLTAVTDVNGQAEVTYTAGGIAGVQDTIRVRLASNLEITATDAVNVSAADVGSIVISATSSTLIADGASQTRLIASVLDPSNNPAEGVIVTFMTGGGNVCIYPSGGACAPGISYTPAGGTDAAGLVEATLESSTVLGPVTVTASALGFSDSTIVTFIPGPIANLAVSASPSNITADGASTSTVSALATDADGHLVTNGQTINFAITAPTDGSEGTLLPLSNTTDGGVASVTYTSPQGIPTTNPVMVLATSINFTTGVTAITHIDEEVLSVNLVVNPSTLDANETDFAVGTATVTNTNNTPVNDGTPVDVLTTGGYVSLTPVTATSTTVGPVTVDGEALFYLRSSSIAGQHFVQATAGSIVAVAPVEFLPGPMDDTMSTLTANPTTIPADGSSISTLTLDAKDQFGNQVADGSIATFSTNAGTLPIPATAITTGGIATMDLVSSVVPTTVGGVMVDAEIDGAIVSTTLTFGDNDSINPNSIELTLSDNSIPLESPEGEKAILITATVRDGAGNLIPDCPDNMFFTITEGPSDVKLDGTTAWPLTKSTVNGTASVSLTGRHNFRNSACQGASVT